MPPHTFRDLALATYCPRKLYYDRRRDDEPSVPADVEQTRELAFRYDELLDAPDAILSAEPIAISPDEFRSNLDRARRRFDRFPDLVAPPDRDVLLTGRECRGIAHKLLETDPPIPVLLSAGDPPPEGVWKPHTVRAVAAAKALAWERKRPIETAFYEYPAHGIVRKLRLTTRRKAAYRRAVRTVESLDGPPPRLRNDAKCAGCEFRTTCGVKTRSLRSLLRR